MKPKRKAPKKRNSNERQFTMVPSDFLRDGTLSMAYRMAWAILRSYAWKTSGSTAKIAVLTLAKHLDCDRRTAQRLLRVLEADTLLTSKKRGRGRGVTSHYLVNDPPVKGVTRDAVSEEKGGTSDAFNMSQMSPFTPEKAAPVSPKVDDSRIKKTKSQKERARLSLVSIAPKDSGEYRALLDQVNHCPRHRPTGARPFCWSRTRRPCGIWPAISSRPTGIRSWKRVTGRRKKGETAP